jgi:hypothetical protein
MVSVFAAFVLPILRGENFSIYETVFFAVTPFLGNYVILYAKAQKSNWVIKK